MAESQQPIAHHNSTGVDPDIRIHNIKVGSITGTWYLVGANIYYNYISVNEDKRYQSHFTNIPKLIKKEHSNANNTCIPRSR